MNEQLLVRLGARADAADTQTAWPTESLRIAQELGQCTWAVPPKFGGQPLTTAERLARAEQLASVCLTTTFILSQRDAATRRLLASPNPTLAERYVPRLARGECFMTVGLSQLTTSRQHGGTALIAEPVADGFRLTGEIPWVTGADHADAIVIGARQPDGQQVLLVLPSGEPGVFVRPPMDLAALKGSRTSSIRLDQVVLKSEWLLNGPAAQVLVGSGAGGLETSALALGHAAGAIADLQAEARDRAELQVVADEFTANHRTARDRLHGLTFAQPNSEDVVNIRVECTRLALRASQAALTAARGTGFVAPHPAQRRARQALFFLVWSCPRPAAEGLLAELSEG